MIKVFTGMVCALVAINAVSRCGEEFPEDTFVREDGSPVKILFYDWRWRDPPTPELRRESPIFRRNIDRKTGRWGYSHVSIDGGEIDKKTGEPLIFDADDRDGVIRRPRSYYNGRRFVEVELSDLAGAEAYGAARMMIGTPYDTMELIGPRNQNPRDGIVCSTFVWHCMPQSIRDQIMECKEGLCSFNNLPTPNQLARALGAPKLEGLVT